MSTLRMTFAVSVATLSFLSTVLASGKVLEIKTEESEINLKTWMVVGNKYQLQCTTNLASGAWTDVGQQITADQATSNLTAGAEAKACWFRVVEETMEIEGPRTPPTPPSEVPSKRPVRKPSI